VAKTPEAVILIVDDKKQNLFALERTLRKVPAKIVQASSGDEALALTLQYDFALAILDVQMPGMDGFELAGMLLGDPATSRIPIIFLTAAYSDEQHRFQGYQSGAVDYIVKPFDPEVLLGKVLVFLELARYRMGLETLVQERTRELTASEAGYRTLIENAFDIIQCVRSDGTIDGVSASWEQALGYTAADLQALTVQTVLAPEARDAAMMMFKQVLSGQTIVNFQTIFVARDGRKVHVEGNIVPNVIDNQVTSARGFFRDVTARREAEKRLEVAVEGAVLGLWDWHMLTGKCVLTGVWPDVEGISSPGQTEIDANTWFGLVHPDDLPGMMAAYRRHFEGETSRYESEFRIRLRDGGWTWLLDIGSIIERDAQGQPLRIVGSCLNISDRKRAEDEQSRLQRAEAESRAKSDFLARMSHEIRTPMNAILGYAQLLRRESGLTARQREYLDTINRSGDHLLGLINQVLDMARIEAGQVPMVESVVNLHDMQLELERMFRITATDHGLWLKFESAEDVPQWVQTDAGKVRQVMINLLSNAMKFTEHGGVVVRSSAVQGDDGQLLVVMEVEDTGCGIEDGQLDTIFEPFGQTDTGSRKAGTGLGLTVSRNLARRMGGDITVHSQLGLRSVFRFEFAAAASNIGDAPVPLSRVIGLSSRSRNCRVLVIDDRPSSRTMLVQMLAAVGFDVRDASSCAEALAAFVLERSDVVLSKLDMPVMDGLEFLGRLRDVPGGKNVPAIIIGATSMDEERVLALNAGANGFLRMPVCEDDLYGEIGRVANVGYVWSRQPYDLGQVTEPPLDPHVAQGMPADLLEGLRMAVEAGYPEAIDLQVDRFEQIDPDVGRGLRVLARDFDYAALIRLLGTSPEA
jgi:PAS domain S-box-containing protein